MQKLTKFQTIILGSLASLALAAGAVGAQVLSVEPAPEQDAQGYKDFDREPLSDSELDELVGRVALYPDDLLAIVLPASTYPLQVVQAARFLDELDADSSSQPREAWDESVLALLNYPEVVSLLDGDLDWTWALGEAVLNQEDAVVAAIERFRDKAYQAGNLKTDDRQVVEVADDGAVTIEPARKEVIYVPYYEPERVIVYQRYPAYYYYPRAYPLYYYPYAEHHYFSSGFFWGVSTAFHINFHSHNLHVYHHTYAHHPYFGHHYAPRYYRHHRYHGQPARHHRAYNHAPRSHSVGGHNNSYRWRADSRHSGVRPRTVSHSQRSYSDRTQRQPHKATVKHATANVKHAAANVKHRTTNSTVKYRAPSSTVKNHNTASTARHRSNTSTAKNRSTASGNQARSSTTVKHRTPTASLANRAPRATPRPETQVYESRHRQATPERRPSKHVTTAQPNRRAAPREPTSRQSEPRKSTSRQVAQRQSPASKETSHKAPKAHAPKSEKRSSSRASSDKRDDSRSRHKR